MLFQKTCFVENVQIDSGARRLETYNIEAMEWADRPLFFLCFPATHSDTSGAPPRTCPGILFVLVGNTYSIRNKKKKKKRIAENACAIFGLDGMEWIEVGKSKTETVIIVLLRCFPW